MANKKNFVDALSNILIKMKAITCQMAESLKEDFAKNSEGDFEEFLLEQGLVSKIDLLKALSNYYQVPSIDITGVFIEHELLLRFPPELMKRKGFIPYEHDGDILIAVAADPSDEELLDIMGDYVSWDITFLVGLKRDIYDAIEEFHQLAPTEVDLDYDRNDRNRGAFQNNSIIKVNLDDDPYE